MANKMQMTALIVNRFFEFTMRLFLMSILLIVTIKTLFGPRGLSPITMFEQELKSFICLLIILFFI